MSAVPDSIEQATLEIMSRLEASLIATGAPSVFEDWMNEELQRGTHPSFVCSAVYWFAAQVVGSVMGETLAPESRDEAIENAARQMKSQLARYFAAMALAPRTGLHS